MSWIESHQSLSRHKKTLRAASLLKVDRHKLIGHLHELWWWGLDNADIDGNLVEVEALDIAMASGWPPTRAAAFVDALVTVGFIDRNGDGFSLHDWYDYAGKLNDRRAKDAGRNRSMRRAYEDGTIEEVRKRDGDHCRYCGALVDWADRKTSRGGTYDHIIPGGPTTVDNLVVACRACNAGKGNRPLSAEMASRLTGAHLTRASDAHRTTVPNRTQPNRTEPDQSEAGASPATTGSRKPARQVRQMLDAEAIAQLQAEPENVDVDVAAVAADYLNWTGSDKHRDQVQALRNQLDIPGKRERFRRRGATGPALTPYETDTNYSLAVQRLVRDGHCRTLPEALEKFPYEKWLAEAEE